MELNDHGLDERLRALARPDASVAERVAARALTAPLQQRRPVARRRVAFAVACALVVAVIGLWYLPRHSATVPATPARETVGMVLVRAPDGSSLIFSTGTPADDAPEGSGFVISEGDHR